MLWDQVYDEDGNKREEKSAFGHLKDVIEHYNEKYNPFKRFANKILDNEESSKKQYFTEDNKHPAQLYTRDFEAGKEYKCEKCQLPLDRSKGKIYSTENQTHLFHEHCLVEKDMKNDQELMKDESILKMSGQHLLNYVLKKKPNIVEHDFINNIMDILIEENV